MRTTKKAALSVNTIQPLEIDVAAIHDIERAGLGHDLIKDVHVVHFAVGDADKRWDIAVQVQQRVHLDGGLGREMRPREQRQAQVDGGGVQRIEALSRSTPKGSWA